MNLRSTYTFALLEVSPETFDEIAEKLREASYDHCFVDEAINMHGIGLVRGPEPAPIVIYDAAVIPSAAAAAPARAFDHGANEADPLGGDHWWHG